MKEQQLIEMAVNLIRLHHGLGMPEREEERMWNIYFNCSPEMKPFKEYLESHPAENLVIASEQPKGDLANGAVAEKIKQCGDCRHNWNFINKELSGYGRGWCYMFENFSAGCGQKIQIDGR